MDPSIAARKIRPLAEVEGDLLSAEEAFKSAVGRLNEAKRDLEGALRRINQHQTELDDAVAALRERSVPGSRWRENSCGELLLSPADITEVSGEPAGCNTPNIHNLSEHFDRLRAVAQSAGRERG
jgi:hypothetical protein